MVDRALVGAATSAERTVVTYLKTPVATPLARLRRVFFEETSIILMKFKIEVHESLCASMGGQRDETNPTKTAQMPLKRTTYSRLDQASEMLCPNVAKLEQEKTFAVGEGVVIQ
jgi:hypothetical protein